MGTEALRAGHGRRPGCLEAMSQGGSQVKVRRCIARLATAMGVALLLAGCATVPKEVVELSYSIGQDLESVHASYRTLVHVHFDGLRTQVNTFIDTRWKPAALRSFIEKGKLVERATKSDPNEVLSGVGNWVDVALEGIERKRHEFLDPISADETALLDTLDITFATLARANATVTAHLNSLRKVQEVQDEALQAMRLKDLRDRLDARLVEASGRTQQALEQLGGATKKVEDVERLKEQLLKKPEGGSAHD